MTQGLIAFILLSIIAVPLYFVWRWVTGMIMPAGRPRKITIWVATLVTAPLAYFVLITLFILAVSYYPKTKFNGQEWRINKKERYKQSANIIDSKMLIGKTKADVVQILGLEENKIQSNEWTYYLGFVPGMFNIDPDVLNIKFKNGKVVSVSQHET